MNLQELFEKKETNDDNDQEVKIRDPLARRLLDKARTKYAYTETDLEAFVKLMQDEQFRDKGQIEALETQIDHADSVNRHQEKELKILRQREKEYHTAQIAQSKQISTNKAALVSIQAEIDGLEDLTDTLTLDNGRHGD